MFGAVETYVGASGLSLVNKVSIPGIELTQGIEASAMRSNERPESESPPSVRCPSRKPRPTAEASSAGEVSRSWILWLSIVPWAAIDRWRWRTCRSAALMRVASDSGGMLR